MRHCLQRPRPSQSFTDLTQLWCPGPASKRTGSHGQHNDHSPCGSWKQAEQRCPEAHRGAGRVGEGKKRRDCRSIRGSQTPQLSIASSFASKSCTDTNLYCPYMGMWRRTLLLPVALKRPLVSHRIHLSGPSTNRETGQESRLKKRTS